MEQILAIQKSTDCEYFAQENILIRLNSLPMAFFWANPQAGYFNKSLNRFVKHKSNFTLPGVADILGFYKDRFCAFEVKIPKKHTYIKKHIDDIYSTHPNNLNKDKLHIWNQKDFIENVKRRGGIAGFVSSYEDCCELIGI